MNNSVVTTVNANPQKPKNSYGEFDMILIIGDSWSCFRPNHSLESEQFYPVCKSLPQRLITQTSHTVIPLAQVGTNDLAVLERVLDSAKTATRETRLSVEWIVWGWSDWTRCLPHQPKPGWPRPVPVCYTGSSQEDWARVTEAVQERVHELEDLLPRACFLHWGGHGSVIEQCAAGLRHRILVKDLAEHTVGAPRNNLGLLSHFAPLEPEEIWPRDSNQQQKQVREQCAKIVEFKQNRKKQFPDGCHLAFDCYDLLEERILEEIS